MAASFNPKLVSQCYRDTAKEATNDGVHWTFTPMLDLCRDPRWGRIIEGTGEDPFVGAAAETVQLYIRDKLATLMRPIRELKSFKKTTFAVGESKTVEFELNYGDLGYYNETGKYTVEKGKIEVFIGENCLIENSITIEIV